MVPDMWMLVTAICVVIGGLFIFNGFFPVIAVDNHCYKTIAEAECPGQEIYYQDGPPFFDTSFKCCKNATKETREWIDNIPDCKGYIFYEEDHKKCSTRYYWFGLKTEGDKK